MAVSVDAPVTRVSSAEVERFLHEALENPEREQPIVVISVPRYTRRPLVSPNIAGERLVGLAQVVALRDGKTSWELSKRVGGELSCYWGAVRLYWPGFDSGTSRKDEHPIWLASHIAAASPEEVLNKIVERISEHASGEAVLREERRLREDAEQRLAKESKALAEERQQRAADKERIEQLLAKVQEQDSRIGEIESERDAAINCADTAEREREGESTRADKAEAKLATLREREAQRQKGISLDQKKAPYSLANGSEGVLKGPTDILVKELAEKVEEATTAFDEAQSELKEARGEIKEEQRRRREAEAQRKAALDEQGRLRDKRDQAESLRKEAENQRSAAEQNRSKLEAHVQKLESGEEIRRLQSRITEIEESHASEQQQWKIERTGYKSEIRNLKEVVQSATQQDTEEEAVEEVEDTQISSIVDAVLMASDLENIDLKRNAYETAGRSQSKKGPELYKVLRVLNQMASQWGKGLGMKPEKWLQRELPTVSFQYSSHISRVARQKLRKEYTFEGTFMEKHIKFGNKNRTLLRMYFEFEDGKCKIGHIGRHLPGAKQ